MRQILLAALIMIAHDAMADDYSEGRIFAENAQLGAFSGLNQLKDKEHEYLNDFTAAPVQSGLDHNALKQAGIEEATRNEAGQEIIEKQRIREQNPVRIDLNSPEMRDAGSSIDGADERTRAANIPCTDGQCLATEDQNGEDFGEGASRLGILTGAAKEISDKQIGAGVPSIFAGKNHRCRIAVKHVGNCCGRHARFLRCRQEEKELSIAVSAGLARYVGTYCAHKLGKCYEHKQSWCVFPSQLANIFQVQGRFQQLGISFGWAGRKTNAADCRGLKPAELERINFQILDLGNLTKEFESRYIPKNPVQMEVDATSKIDAMEREGRAHD